MSLMRSVLDEVHFQHFPPLLMKEHMTMRQQPKLYFFYYSFTSPIQSLLDGVHFQHFPPLPMKDFMNIVTMVPIVVYSCYSSTTGVSRPLADFSSSFT